jgi:F420H(2)-dependent quinone reductase
VSAPHAVPAPLVTARLLANRAHARLLVASRGRLGARLGSRPVLVLETRGRRSGRLRRTPVQYLRHESGLVLVASNGGRPTAPAWSLNLQARPLARALVDGTWIAVCARTAEGEERERLWAMLAHGNPWLTRAAGRAGREFPVIVLECQG